ncbi:hypothetical protein E2562_035848 [Oryza meyeriana var. granulata]|uniref:PROP1-like PPR domain-containing protein n=1 Tax=Oryza meyeriana var. granulata TaxID=110450 RepID=A0A6G1DS86_9ORYZ|nr:hypothetical protein E2562_035848 [Oryza meyeriana var. granulata]
MRARSIVPDVHACSALLTVLARSRMMATTRKVFDEMARAGVAMNTHVYNAMLHVCLKVGDAALAKSLMTKMDATSVPLDRFSFNTMIALYCRKGMQYEAMCVRERMENESRLMSSHGTP